MSELFAQFPFQKTGWAVLQLSWISALYLGGWTLVLNLLEKFSSTLKYKLGLGALLSFPIIASLLFVEHQGLLPPIGFAQWGVPETAEAARQPLIQGLPQFTGFELGSLVPHLYYVLGIFWTAAAAFLLSFNIFTLIRMRLLCRKKPELNNPEIHAQLQKLANTLDISAKFDVRTTSYQNGPAVVGIIHPYMLIPKSLSADYSEREIRGLLLHELIHIKHQHYLFAFLQRMVLSVLFFQPLAWWFSRKVDLERELVCDRAVTSITEDSYTYGNTLAKLKLQTHARLSLALNVADKSTVKRIKNLVEAGNSSFNFVQKFRRICLAMLIIGTILFSTFWNCYHLHHSHNSHLQSTGVSEELVQVHN